MESNKPIELTYAEIRELLLARAQQRAQKSKPLVMDRIWAVADENADETNDKAAERERRRLERLAKLSRLELGDLGERAFEMVAAEHRIASARPTTAGLPLDVITIARRPGYPIWKVQVRGISTRVFNTYHVGLRRAHGKPYKPGDFDFFAAWVIPEDAWYIIPFAKLPMKLTAFHLHPHAKSKKKLGPLDRFQDRWDLLK